MLPYGLTINVGPDAYWLVPLATIFSIWIIYSIIIYIRKKYFFRVLLYVIALAFNLLVIFTQSFYVVLPVPDNIISIFWYVLIGITFFEWNYTSRMEKKQKEKNEIK